MAGKIFWILACNQEMQITPLSPASHCPAQPTPQERDTCSQGDRSSLWHQECLGVSFGHTVMLLCSPCMSGTPPQSPSSTHHTETLPADTGALAANSGKKYTYSPFWSPQYSYSVSPRQFPCRSPLRPTVRKKVQISAETWAHRAHISNLFVLQIAKWRQCFLSTCKGVIS